MSRRPLPKRDTNSRRSARYCRADNREPRPRGPDRATRTDGRSQRLNDKGVISRKYAWHILLLKRHADSSPKWAKLAQPWMACAALIWGHYSSPAREDKSLVSHWNTTIRGAASRRLAEVPRAIPCHRWRSKLSAPRLLI